jgi:hypothetical protein
MFTPQFATDALKHYFTDTELWNYRIGFGDAYNLDPPDCNGPWYNRAVFGIDNGPMLIAIENHRSDFVWETIRGNGDIERALSRLFVLPEEIGVHRGRGFFLDANGNNRWDKIAGGDNAFRFDQRGTPIAGDFNADGFTEVGIHRRLAFFLDQNGNGTWDGNNGGDRAFKFAQKGRPIAGDWDGDGMDEIGIHRRRAFFLDMNGNGTWDGNQGGDWAFKFAQKGRPIAGDWDGDGMDEIGIHRRRAFFLDMNGNGTWDGNQGGDRAFKFAQKGTPIAGDWNGDGVDEVGIKRGLWFFLDLNNSGSWDKIAGGDLASKFAQRGAPITGHWAPTPPPLLAAGGPAAVPSAAETLNSELAAPLLGHALDVFAALPLTPLQQQRLTQVDLRIADVPGARLGQAVGTTIVLDLNAADYGWFVDATPWNDVEFSRDASGDGSLTARRGEAQDRMDALTAVMHELGHVLGYKHADNSIMQEELALGTRWLWPDEVDAAFGN